MTRPTRSLVPLAVGSVVGAIALTIGAIPANAQNPNPPGAPVNIVNPLPVPVSGSVAIAPGSSVQIASDAAHPIAMRSVDPPGFEPAHGTVTVSLAGNLVENFSRNDYVVPPGKRLIVEDLSAIVTVPTAGRPDVSITVRAPAGENSGYARWVPLTFARALETVDWFVGAGPARLILPAGWQLGARAGRTPGTASSSAAQVTFIGYLIDEP